MHLYVDPRPIFTDPRPIFIGSRPINTLKMKLLRVYMHDARCNDVAHEMLLGTLYLSTPGSC